MESDQNLKQLKRNTLLSTLSLFFQSGYSAILGLTANLVITIVLPLSSYGIYLTVLASISLFNYFSDLGLAASLIQKKEINNDDLKTSFTIQQLLVLTLVTTGFLATRFIMNFYHFPPEGIQLYWAVLMSFFISSLKTIPSVLLERHIQFQKIVLVQIVENTLFFVSVIIFAIIGLGLQSFVYAVILRSVVGLILIYSISFWKPQLGISSVSLKELLSFGLPFQSTSFLALFKDDLITLFLAKVIGLDGVAVIGWAKKWAEAPIRIIMDNLSRVLFPLISRMKDDHTGIKRLIDRILRYQTLLLAPVLLGAALTMHIIITIIPNYSKFRGALPFFYIFCITSFLSSYSTPFINLFNALKKVKISFGFMLFWTITTWICTPYFTHLFGLWGFPLTQLILGISSIAVVIKARNFIKFDIVSSIMPPFISAVIMGITVYILQQFIASPLLSLIVSITSGGIVYIATIQFVFKINLFNEIKSLFAK